MFDLRTFRLHYTAKSLPRLPDYTGGLWRGAIGNTLRSRTCLTGAATCTGCPVMHQCLYGRMYENPRPERAIDLLSKYTELPHPYIVCPQDVRVPMAGQPARLAVDLTLIGELAGEFQDVQPHLTRLKLNDVPLELESATPIGLQPMPAQPPPALRVRCLTPMRLKARGHYVRAKPFHPAIFVKTLLRRLSMLYATHNQQPIPADTRGLSKMAEEITMQENNLEWYDWQRLSTRQARRIPMGGLVGSFDISGFPAELWPLLWFGQWSHVGKGAVMGMGRYRLQLLGNAGMAS